MLKEERSYYRPLLTLLAATTFIRLIYINLIPLAPDEAYYWDLSRRLQLSYYDHPPMLMYIIRAATTVLGNTEFAVRLPSVVMAAVVTMLVYLTGRELYDERTGFYSALLVNITLIYSVGGLLATVDTPFALFWCIALYSTVKVLKSGDRRWWYPAGAALGLGMLSKYIMVLFVPALFMFLIASREHRRYLWEKELYLASVLALIFFSPVLIWNFSNDWASFKFQFAHGMKVKKKAGLPSFMQYLGSQIGTITPVLFMAAVWAVIRSVMIWLRERDWRSLYLACMASFVVAFFGYSSFRAKVEGNWPMSAYFAAFVALASLYVRSVSPRKGLAAKVVAVTALFFTLAAHLQALTPVIPLRKDMTDQFHGWKEVGIEVEKKMREAGAEIIIADSHQLTAELAFYTPSQLRVYEIGGQGKFNQYNMWGGPSEGTGAVLVDNPGKEEDPFIRSLFGGIREIGRVDRRRGDKIIKTYSIYACDGFKGFPD